jgi:hypothetical protein
MTDTLRDRLQIRHAAAMAAHAEDSVEAKWFCRTWQAHRVRTPGAACPCCEDRA